MRSTFAICIVLACASAITMAAERAWKSGIWAPRSDARAYVIETATEVISGEPSPGDQHELSSTAGSRVRYAIEGRTLYVLDADNTEHALTLLGSAAKYSRDYAALGAGHYIVTVAVDGSSVTLEDGSRWDLDPQQHFRVADWQRDDLISVRRSSDDPNFAYEIDNTSQDDGALANHRAR